MWDDLCEPQSVRQKLAVRLSHAEAAVHSPTSFGSLAIQALTMSYFSTKLVDLLGVHTTLVDLVRFSINRAANHDVGHRFLIRLHQ